MKYLLLLTLFSCAHREIKLTGTLTDMLVSDHTPVQGKVTKDKVHPTLQSQWMGQYWQVQEGLDLLQDTEAATVSVRIKLDSIPTELQDIVAFSVGGSASSASSRFSIRLNHGQITAILRAGDQETAQEYMSTGAALRVNQWHTVTVVGNYSKNTASIYLDGHKLEGTGTLKFSQKKTAATPSASMAFGSEDDGSTLFYKGKIAQILVWKRELSREEIYQLH
jgi:hypothetical protein